MTKEEIIASGLLELYVTGSLPQDDIVMVERAIAQNPELISEIERIEQALMNLSEVTGGNVSGAVWGNIKEQTAKVRTLKPSSKTNWSAITGWAAAVLCLAGLFWMMKTNNDLEEQIQYSNSEKEALEEQLNIQESDLAETSELLEMVRSKDFKAITLPGNEAVAANAYATVYYNEKEDIAYIDAKGLPEPPKGKVYQVWSLKMEPLTPSSIGLLTNFESNENLFFKVENIPAPEAFGITLEPEGGSDSPSLDQLYTLGMVTP